MSNPTIVSGGLYEWLNVLKEKSKKKLRDRSTSLRSEFQYQETKRLEFWYANASVWFIILKSQTWSKDGPNLSSN